MSKLLLGTKGTNVPRFKSWCRRHMLFGFVVGSLLCTKSFLLGSLVFPSASKQMFANSNSTRNQGDEEALSECQFTSPILWVPHGTQGLHRASLLISVSCNSPHILPRSPSCFCSDLFNRSPSGGFWYGVRTFQFPIFFYPSTCSAWVTLPGVQDSSRHSSIRVHRKWCPIARG